MDRTPSPFAPLAAAISGLLLAAAFFLWAKHRDHTMAALPLVLLALLPVASRAYRRFRGQAPRAKRRPRA